MAFCFAGASTVALAQTKDRSSDDTLKRLPEKSVKITALRPSDLPTIDPRGVEIKPAAELSRITGSNLASDALEAMSSSLDIRSYGSLGSIAVASFRDLPAEYTIFYRDGIRLTNEQLGETDLGQLTMRGISAVELIPSANAVLLGGDAIGAAINFVSAVRDSDIVRLGSAGTSYSGAGSIPEHSYSVQIAPPLGESLSGGAGFSSDRSSGEFPFFQQASNEVVLRENNDAALSSEFLNLAWQPDTSTSITAISNGFQIDRGVPGQATTPGRGANDLLSRQTDRQAFAALKLDHSFPIANISLSLSYNNQFETYRDSSLGIQDSATNELFGLSLRADHSFTESITGFAGVEYQHTRLTGTTNAAANDSIIGRDRVGTYAAIRAVPFAQISLAASVRAESISQVPEIPLLPQLSLDYTPLDWLSARLAYSRSFHAPTLNDLFWRGLGNPNLQPENGESEEFAIDAHDDFGRLECHGGATLFSSSVQDQILWLPATSGLDRPINIDHVVSQGIELEVGARYDFNSAWSIRFEEQYTIDNAENRTPGDTNFGKEIIYTTPTSSRFNAALDRSGWGTLDLFVRYRGHKFATPDNSLDAELLPITLYDLTASSAELRMSNAIGLRASLSIQNIGNLQYEEQIGYPMPGRSYNFSIELNYR